MTTQTAKRKLLSFGLGSLGSLPGFVEQESLRYKVSKIKIYLDMAKLYCKCRIGPNYYLLAGFADPNIPFEMKTQHLNDEEYHRCLNRLNPKEYRKITQHKLSEKALLQLLGVPMADFVAYWSDKGGFAMGNAQELKSLDDLDILLRRYRDRILCFKMLEGWGGRGFFAGRVELADGNLIIGKLYSDDIYGISDIAAHFKEHDATGSFLVESYIEQTEAYSQFNESSLNTVRVWVLEKRDGSADVLGAYLRVGRRGSLTDGGENGGFKCPLDLDSGRVGPGVFMDTPFREEIVSHPDTNAPIAGKVLEGFPEIKALCCETLVKIPHIRFAGFDVAMSVAGPVIVEINVCPDKNGAAFARIPSRMLLDNI